MNCRNATTGLRLQCYYGCCSVRGFDNRCCELNDFSRFGLISLVLVFVVVLVCLIIKFRCLPQHLAREEMAGSLVNNDAVERRAQQLDAEANAASDAPPTYYTIFGDETNQQISTIQISPDNLTRQDSKLNPGLPVITVGSNLAGNELETSNRTRYSDSVQPPSYDDYIKEQHTILREC